MNKIALVPLLFAFFLLLACDSSVRFGVSQKYRMDKGEYQGRIDQTIVSRYESVINTDTLNLPLNRYILAKDYKVYIGVSFTLKAQELYGLYRGKSGYQILNETETAQGVLFTFQKADGYFYSYLFDADDDKLTYLLTLEAASATVQNMYEQQFLPGKVAP